LLQLLADPSKRLGKDDITEITGHPFFRDIKWGTLHAAAPVFVPSLKDDSDCSYFEKVPQLFFCLVSLITLQAEKVTTNLDEPKNAAPLPKDPWETGWDWSSNP
jgi:hypothetical protein